MARDSILKVNNYFDDLDDMCVLELEGAIDAYTVFYLRERFEDLYERNCYRVLVDCQLVTYISSSGIELFLTVLETIQENKGTFVLTNLAEKVIEVFNLLGLTNIFSIYQDNDEAIGSLWNISQPILPQTEIRDALALVSQTEVECPAELEYLSSIRNFVHSVALDLPFSDKELHFLLLAIDEAISNVIRHAYKNFPEEGKKLIRVKVELNDNSLTIRVKDNAPSFDPSSHQLPDLQKHLEQQKGGGLGRWLMFNIMDSVQYLPRSGTTGNELIMVKYVKRVSLRDKLFNSKS